jgi:hypothetical protein
MPEFLLKKLKQEYGADSKIPYKIANAKGWMKGPNETALGRKMDQKHEAKMSGRSTAKKK